MLNQVGRKIILSLNIRTHRSGIRNYGAVGNRDE